MATPFKTYKTDPLPNVDPRRIPENILRVGATLDIGRLLVANIDPGVQAAELFEIHKDRPLDDAIAYLCAKWNLPSAENASTAAKHYALKFEGPDAVYITEDNRHTITNGLIIQLASSPEQCTVVYLQHLHVAAIEGEHRTWLAKLRSLTADAAFAKCFYGHNGMNVLLDMLVSDACVGEALELLIDCVDRVGRHTTLHDWTQIEDRVVNCVVGFVNGSRTNERDALLVSAMKIIDAMLRGCSPARYMAIASAVPLDRFVAPLRVHHVSATVQHAALTLINALFLRATAPTDAHISSLLMSEGVRHSICTNVIDKHHVVRGTPLYAQLAIMQRRILNLVHNAATVEVDAQDTRLTKLSENMASAVGLSNLDLWRVDNLLADLKNPPGSLALDCMIYFTEHHGFYTRSIVERQLDSTSNNNVFDCLEGSLAINAYNCDPLPIVSAAVVVVRSLIRLLNMDIPASTSTDETHRVHRLLLLGGVDAFYRMFAVVLKAMHRTWIQMRATKLDMPKVQKVLDCQLVHAFDENDQRSCTKAAEMYEHFADELAVLDYEQIQQRWTHERVSEYEMTYSIGTTPQLELEVHRARVVPLVRNNRYKQMQRGTRFAKFTRGQRAVREKDNRAWLWQLAANKKVID